MTTVAELSHRTNTKAACAAFNIPRATYYRQTANLTVANPAVRLASPPLALTLAEEQKVLDVLHEPRFRDLAPSQVYATLLDEGIYHCSIRTMYRILTKHDEVRERRRQVTRPHYEKRFWQGAAESGGRRLCRLGRCLIFSNSSLVEKSPTGIIFTSFSRPLGICRNLCKHLLTERHWNGKTPKALSAPRVLDFPVPN